MCVFGWLYWTTTRFGYQSSGDKIGYPREILCILRESRLYPCCLSLSGTQIDFRSDEGNKSNINVYCLSLKDKGIILIVRQVRPYDVRSRQKLFFCKMSCIFEFESRLSYMRMNFIVRMLLINLNKNNTTNSLHCSCIMQCYLHIYLARNKTTSCISKTGWKQLTSFRHIDVKIQTIFCLVDKLWLYFSEIL